MNHNKKGITPVVSIIILLIIAVAVVGLAYGFITGIVGTATGKAAFISGVSQCDSAGLVTISYRNVGTQTIVANDVNIQRTSCSPSSDCTTGQGLEPPSFTKSPSTGPNEAGTAVEQPAAAGFSPCGSGHTCIYSIDINSIVYTTRADC